MSRVENTLGPFVGFHGCDKKVAEKVLAGKATLNQSENDYDWLGPGIYFWADSPERAYNWAVNLKERKEPKIETPSVVGAFIYPGLCLNLTDIGTNRLLLDAYKFLCESSKTTNSTMPKNQSEVNGIFMRRQLDCAVINVLHESMEWEKKPPFDTVYGVFEEGGPLFPGSGFREKTHIQIAVRNPKCIIGYFRTELT